MGAIAAIAAVVIGAAFARRQERLRHRGELIASAVVDLFEAMAESSLGDQRAAMVLFAQSKARLLAFASSDLVEHLRAFERAGSTGATPAGQAALVGLVETTRSVVGAEGVIDAADMRVLLFGDADEPLERLRG